MKAKTIVVKIGTNALTLEDGELNTKLIKDLVRQIANVMKEYNVLLVTSGAMGAGRALLGKEMKYDEVTSRQLFAVVGQVKLMQIYSDFFKEHEINVAQMLATKNDFDDRSHHLNTKNCIESLFREGIVPIMNENDFVCIEELMFTDNDELAGMICKMLFADKFVILSNVGGVLDENGEVIEEIGHDAVIPPNIVTTDKSSFGKGGMQTKFKIAQDVAAHGTDVYITSSKIEDVIMKIVYGEALGTHFKAKK